MFRRNWTSGLIAGLIAWMFLGLSVQAQEVERVSLEELKSMVEKGEPVVVVDNRPKTEYDRQHIKGAISLPWQKDVRDEARRILPKDNLIVTYCDCGPGESDSADVAHQLIVAGFDNVKILADGWTPWLQAGYPVEKGRK